MTHTRRRSNSKGHIEDMRVTKFEIPEEDPVYEERDVVESIDSASSSSLESTDKS